MKRMTLVYVFLAFTCIAAFLGFYGEWIGLIRAQKAVCQITWAGFMVLTLVAALAAWAERIW